MDELNQLPHDVVQETVTRAKMLEQNNSKRNTLFKRYREMYFMDNMDGAKNSGSVDRGDWKLTSSPSARNEVIGMKRLLDTSDMHVKVLENGEASRKSDRIEAGLKRILDVSGEGRQARVESDAILSAILFGPVILGAESIDDMLSVKDIQPYKRAHLQRQRNKSPFLIRTINPEEHYCEIDEGMVILSEWRYSLKGSVIKARFGNVMANDTQNYTVRDIFTPEYHIIDVEGVSETVYAKKHTLGCVPIVVSVAGGSELFHTPEEQLHSFLYAKAKGELDYFENSILTSIRTQMNVRGLLGPMYWIDPENAPENITIDYQNGIMYAKGRVSEKTDSVIDPVVFKIKDMLDDISGQSTIYKQTLGESIGGNNTFSSLAMLSSAGKLPLVDPQRALEQAFRDIFLHILYRIKQEGMENNLIEPSEIPDNLEIEVTFEPKLPQDNLRNSQMAMNLGDLVSDEWKHSELLQIGDSDAMRKKVAEEQLTKAMLQFMMQDQNFMQQMLQTALPGMNRQGQGRPGQPPRQPQPGMLPQQGQPPAPMDAQQIDPQMMQAMMQQQGNTEAMPQTDPMIPPQERM